MDKRTASPRTAPPTSPPGTEPAGSAPGTAEAEATTTTSTPQRPTTEDIALLGFAQTFELTARDVYQAALDAGLAEGEYADLFVTVRENHEEYGNVLSGILGVDAPQRRDDALYEQLVADFQSGDPATVAEAGYTLESTAIATHDELIGQLVGLDGIAALASFVVVEARHLTALGHVAGMGNDLDALLASDAEPLTPTGSTPAGWRNH